MSFFELFKEQTKIEITDLEKFITENNWEKVAGIAHKLKSSYGSIGSTSAYKILAELEEICKNAPDYNLVIELNNKYSIVQDKILDEMDKFISN
ncbi:MAG: Hpt domain-containing protein [Ignavibacteriae bacterium]|nr:Hpt domain-containing protein [Ignavibacteriota bacterium]